VDTAWTEEQRRAYQRAVTWAEEQLIPAAPTQAYAVWFAKIGHEMFVRQEPAFRWWSAESPEYDQ